MAELVFRSVEELQATVGEQLGPTEWVEVDQQTVNMFADATGDHQWIHVDPKRAASSPFGSTIVHGHLTLSMIPGFASQLYSIQVGTARLNYGLDKVRFPAPIPVGSKIRATAAIKHLRVEPAGIKLVVIWAISAQGVERPVCVAETITLLVGG